MKIKKLIMMPIALVFIGCNGDKAGTKGDNVNSVPQLYQALPSHAPLTNSEDISFSQYYRNGLYLNSLSQSTLYNQAGESNTAVSQVFSNTNTHVAGIDELDRVKYDGDTLFVSTNSHGSKATESGNSRVRLLEKVSDDGLYPSAEISLNTKDYVQGLYIQAKRLAVISSVARDEERLAQSLWYPLNSGFSLSFYDTTDKQAPTQLERFVIDGHVIASRKVENKIYIVSSFAPSLDEITPYAITDEAKRANYDLVSKVALSDVLPKIVDKNGQSKPLISGEKCHYPNDAKSNEGNDSLILLSVIDLSNPKSLNTTCVSARADNIYMSHRAIYLYGNNTEGNGAIHMFEIEDSQISYSASGVVSGGFFGANSQFRFHDNGEQLNVVSTRYVDTNPDHRLSVLTVNKADNALELLATLPNEEAPMKIGKEGEELYAVRFVGSKAYVVTFERTDPLYVIDLELPHAPKIVGALEIPGYSAYLHPIGENLLLGIGQQANIANTPVGGDDNITILPVIEQGAKVSLFDVSDAAAPQQVASLHYPTGYTPAEFDHHALTYVKTTDGNYRFALPIEDWQSVANHDGAGWRSEVSLRLIELDMSTSEATLEEVGAIEPPSDERFIGAWHDRSVLDGDNVYYIHGGRVWHTLWHKPSAVGGPY